MLEDAISAALGTLGETARGCIIPHMRRTTGSRPGKVDAERFHRYLAAIFGAGGAALERIALKRLYSEIGLTFRDRRGWTFAQYVKFAEGIWKRKSAR